LIPDSVHLELISTGKPDSRHRTTKVLRKEAENLSLALQAIRGGAATAGGKHLLKL